MHKFYTWIIIRIKSIYKNKKIKKKMIFALRNVDLGLTSVWFPICVHRFIADKESLIKRKKNFIKGYFYCCWSNHKD